jgi:CRP/FNR family transcriptional regulator
VNAYGGITMQLLSSCRLFQGLSEPQLHLLSNITTEIQIQKGQWLMHEGQEAKEMFVVKEGAVELLSKIDDGFELPIAVLRKPGSFTGVSILVSPYVYSLSSRCVEDGKVLVFEQTELEKLMTEDHELGCIMMRNLSKYLLEHLKETRQEVKIHFKNLLKSAHP